MKFSLLFAICILPILQSQFYTANLQLVAVPQNETSHLGAEELKVLHQKAKNISYSKGFTRETNGKDPEYRRSIIRAMELKTNSLELRKILGNFENVSVETVVTSLENLQYLVHQYDTAIDFMSIGGMKFLLEMLHMDDERITSAALLVLATAMQGNPVVQKMAMENDVLDIILTHLAKKKNVAAILYVTSSYLRDMPNSQMGFFLHHGIDLLVQIIKNRNSSLRSKMHAINILADLGVGLSEDSSVPNEKVLLKKEFTGRLKSANVCDEITVFLEQKEIPFNHKLFLTDYMIHDKIINAMDSLYIFCNPIFQKRQIRKLLQNLIVYYDPDTKLPWTSNDDMDLKNTLYQDLVRVYKKIYKQMYDKKTEL